MFKCDWIKKNDGVRIDELGYVLTDLNRVGHKSYSFILVTQARQVFYVEDPRDFRWSVVLTEPQSDFEDKYNDDELGGTILQCQGIPIHMLRVYLNNDLYDNISIYVRSDYEGTWIPSQYYIGLFSKFHTNSTISFSCYCLKLIYNANCFLILIASL